MKTSKIIVSLLLLSVLVSPVFVLAETLPSGPPSVSIGSLGDLYTKIGTLLWQIVAIVALVMLVVAGILFMLAQGDPTKIATARQFVLWAVVGIVIAIIAFSIVGIVTSFFA